MWVPVLWTAGQSTGQRWGSVRQEQEATDDWSERRGGEQATGSSLGGLS